MLFKMRNGQDSLRGTTRRKSLSVAVSLSTEPPRTSAKTHHGLVSAFRESPTLQSVELFSRALGSTRNPGPDAPASKPITKTGGRGRL
jgi:hypothetical protein